MDDRIVRFGIVGIGGYALTHLHDIKQCAQQGTAALTAAAVRSPAKYARQVEAMEKEGVRFFKDLPEMLDQAGSRIDVVVIPSGIDSHEAFTIGALEKGFHVLCEKPVAATVQERDRMIAARDKAGKFVAIGFQTIYGPAVQHLKKRIAAGEFGRLLRGASLNFGARPPSYYARNAWAGRYASHGRWILDSPLCNAQAHYVQLMLYLAGERHHQSAEIESIVAELYRAKPVETFDTFAVRMELQGGADLLCVGSHSVPAAFAGRISMEFEKATICFGKGIEVTVEGQREEPLASTAMTARQAMFENVMACCRNGGHQHGTLENGGALTLAVNGAHESCPEPFDVAPEFLERLVLKDCSQNPEDSVVCIRNGEELLQRCFTEQKLPSELGAEWAQTSRAFRLTGYKRFPVDKGLAKYVAPPIG